jgi:hypothetical protein
MGVPPPVAALLWYARGDYARAAGPALVHSQLSNAGPPATGVAWTFETLGHYGTLGIEDVIVTFSYPDCLSSSALASASFDVLKLSA